jgi:hypothetical protein
MWQRILFQSTQHEVLSQVIKSVLENDGFKLYDPFAGGTGTPVGIKERLRMFLAPPLEGWTRLAIAPQDVFSQPHLESVAIQTNVAILNLQVVSEEAFQVIGYEQGKALAMPENFGAFLRSGTSPEHIMQVWRGETLQAVKDGGSDLPADIQAFAEQKGVNVKAVDRMMGKMTRRINKKMQGENQDAAKAALASNSGMNWKSVGARTLLGVAECLAIPAEWRSPDWQLLTDAYQAARQKQRGGLILPTDEKMLQSLPDALNYQPLYFAKK